KIILEGTINNPIGVTHILNERGDIVNADVLPPGHIAIVRTNQLAAVFGDSNLTGLEATFGSIGTAANPINIELVNSETVAKVDRPIVATVLAAADVYLN